nr:unnamed protein product [Callosobruchus chinensis]
MSDGGTWNPYTKTCRKKLRAQEAYYSKKEGGVSPLRRDAFRRSPVKARLGVMSIGPNTKMRLKRLNGTMNPSGSTSNNTIRMRRLRVNLAQARVNHIRACNNRLQTYTPREVRLRRLMSTPSVMPGPQNVRVEKIISLKEGKISQNIVTCFVDIILRNLEPLHKNMQKKIKAQEAYYSKKEGGVSPLRRDAFRRSPVKARLGVMSIGPNTKMRLRRLNGTMNPSAPVPGKKELWRIKPQSNLSTAIDEDIILRNLEPLHKNMQKKIKAQEAYYSKKEGGVSPLRRDAFRRSPVKARLGVMSIGPNTKMRLRRLNGTMNPSGRENHFVERRQNIANIVTCFVDIILVYLGQYFLDLIEESRCLMEEPGTPTQKHPEKIKAQEAYYSKKEGGVSPLRRDAFRRSPVKARLGDMSIGPNSKMRLRRLNGTMNPSAPVPGKKELWRIKPQSNLSTAIDEDIILRNLEPLHKNMQKKIKAQEAYYSEKEGGVSPLRRDAFRRSPVKARLGVMSIGPNTKMRLKRLNGTMNPSGRENHFVERRQNIAKYRYLFCDIILRDLEPLLKNMQKKIKAQEAYYSEKEGGVSPLRRDAFRRSPVKARLGVMSIGPNTKMRLKRLNGTMNPSDIILRNLEPLHKNMQKKIKAQEAYYSKKEGGVSPLRRDAFRRSPVKARLGVMSIGPNTKMRLRRLNGTMDPSDIILRNLEPLHKNMQKKMKAQEAYYSEKEGGVSPLRIDAFRRSPVKARLGVMSIGPNTKMRLRRLNGTMNPSVLLYILVHKEMKTEARQEKERYKNDLNKRVYIVDIQSLLLCLKSTVSLLYYKMKLVVHNNIKTKEAHSFIWNASEGGIGSNEFSSILTFFIQNKIKDMGQVRELMFYSKWMQWVIMYHSQTPYLNCPFNMTLLLSRDT